MIVHAGVAIMLVVSFQSVYSSTCKQFQPRKDNLNIALIGHSVMEINETNHHECAKTCMSFKICKSIDYDRKEKTCKLNDADRSSIHPLEFKTKKGLIFSDISEWPSEMVGNCSSRPCRANQRCYQKEGSHVCKFLNSDDCFTNNVWKYAGKMNVTRSGLPCDGWDNHIGEWDIDVQYIPESSFTKAENYCRNPSPDEYDLWCFLPGYFEYEYCDIPRCL